MPRWSVPRSWCHGSTSRCRHCCNSTMSSEQLPWWSCSPSMARTCGLRPELFGSSLRYRIIAGGLVRAEEYLQAVRHRTVTGARDAGGDGERGCDDAADCGARGKAGAIAAREPVHAAVVHDSFQCRWQSCAFGMLRICRERAAISRCKLPVACWTMRPFCAWATPYEKATAWRDRRPSLVAEPIS